MFSFIFGLRSCLLTFFNYIVVIPCDFRVWFYTFSFISIFLLLGFLFHVHFHVISYTFAVFVFDVFLQASIVRRDSGRQSPEAKFTPNT